MMKRVAAAVLYSVVAASGAAEFNDDDVTAIVERGASGERRSSRVLENVAQLCGTEIDAAFITADSSAAAAVTISSEDAHVSIVDVALTRRAPSHLNDALRQALDHCRHTGTLKIQINLDTLPLHDVRPLAESRGFVFSRQKMRDGSEMAEFYTDLYWSDSDGRA